jgi:hypothetical protein
VDGSMLRGGETFTITDGFNPPAVFEFRPPSGTVGPGHVPVDFTPGSSVDDVGLAMAAAINDLNVGRQLLVTAQYDPALQAVLLTHDMEGTVGNRPLYETVQAAAFRVNGLAGGVGHDCPLGAGCSQNGDCRTNRCDTSTVPGTCSF